MSAEKTTKDRSTGEKKKREFNHVSNIPSVNKGNTHKEVEKFMEKRRREKLAEKLAKKGAENPVGKLGDRKLPGLSCEIIKKEFKYVSNIPSVNKGNTHKEVEKFMEKRRREKLAEKLSKERNRNLN